MDAHEHPNLILKTFSSSTHIRSRHFGHIRSFGLSVDRRFEFFQSLMCPLFVDPGTPAKPLAVRSRLQNFLHRLATKSAGH